MAQMLYKTKNNSDPKGKPKVYFTCHPADRERFFKKIWDDISATHDVALYYTKNMTEPFDDEHLETDLGQMNLFVIPVTGQLLNEPNRAMDVDIAYAKAENIPILPFMMEPGLDDVYSDPSKFGNRQYLEPFSSDVSAIRYSKKLKKYLESVLISNETVKRVRAAFDAYIFLSYRKKDRRYAHELMKLIHNDPECWSIAVWYDEFLTPGESFWDGIQKALEDSRLFALLVTPNLLEYSDGKPNFVMGEEYPAAVKANKTILPAELVPTDHTALAENFRDIPDCIDPHDNAVLKELLLQSLHKAALSACDRDPEHSFLLGLAYLDGIDVEANRRRGIELITSASEKGLVEAMKKLHAVYKDGDGIDADHEKALHLAERIYKKTVKRHGRKHPESIDALCMLADDCTDCCHLDGNYDRAIALQNKAYDLIQKRYGKTDPRLPEILLNLAKLSDLGIINKDPIRYMEKAHALQAEVLGEDAPDTIDTLQRIARFCTDNSLFEYELDAVAIWEKIYELQCKTYGKDSVLTQKSERELNSLRSRMSKEQAHVLDCDKQYRSALESLGETNPKTLEALCALAAAYGRASEHAQAVWLYTEAYTLMRKSLGRKHPGTVAAKHELAHAYKAQGNFPKALRLYKQIYSERCRTLGKTNPQTVDYMMDMFKVHLQSEKPIRIILFLKRYLSRLILSKAELNGTVLENARMLPSLYMALHMNKKAIRWAERVYELHCNTLGETHTDTVTSLATLCMLCTMQSKTSISKRAFSALEKTHAEICEKHGPADPIAGRILGILSMYYEKQGLHRQIIALTEQRYEAFREALGDGDEKTTNALNELARCNYAAGEYLKAGELFAEVWKLQCSQLSASHKDTQQTMSEIEECLENLKGDSDYGKLLEVYNTLKAQTPSGDDIDARLNRAFEAASEGKYEKAATLLEAEYQYAIDEGEEEDLNAVEMLKMIASWYNEANNTRKAAEILQKIYDLRCELQGEEHEDTLSALHELAYALFKLRNRTKALSLFESVYALRCKVLGEEHADTLATLHRIAHTNESIAMSKKNDAPKEALARFNTAAELYEKAYASMCKVLGEGHEETLSVLRKLAYVYKELGDYPRSADIYGREFASRCKVFGTEEHETASPLYLQAGVYRDMGDHRKAAELYSLLHSVYCNAKGRADCYAQDALSALAEQCSLMGNHEMAVKLYGQVYSVYLQANGEDDWNTQLALQHLTEAEEKAASADSITNDGIRIDLYDAAMEARKAGDHETALALLEETYAFRCDILGAEHPLTQEAKEKIENAD